MAPTVTVVVGSGVGQEGVMLYFPPPTSVNAWLLINTSLTVDPSIL